jgi:uncharacterized protein YjdB
MNRVCSISAALVTAVVTLLPGCGEGDATSLDTGPRNPSFSTSTNSVTLNIGESVTLEPNPKRIKNTRNLRWESSNPAVAPVTSDGVVTGVSGGSAMVFAISANLRDTTYVTVLADEPPVIEPPAAVFTVRASPKVMALEWINATAIISATVTDQDGNQHSEPQLVWHSLNPAVAEVDAMGNVVARTAGTALIVVSAACCQTVDTVSVAVTQRVSSVTLKSPAPDLQLGQELQLEAQALDQGGTVVPNTVIDWASENLSVATVSATGLVSGVGAGSATVLASHDSYGDRVSLEVRAPAIAPGAALSIPLNLHRLDGGAGTVRVSSGVLLQPGQLQASAADRVAVAINGVEVPAYVEALHGRHRDGSVVSVLLQFDADPALQPQATLLLGTTPAQPRLAKRSIDFRPASADVKQNGFPAVVAVPPVAHMVAAVQMFGPTTSVADAAALGGSFLAFENDFQQWSTNRWNALTSTSAIGANYYDRGFHHMVWFHRSGNPEYLRRGAAYTFNHRVQYYEPNAYNIAQERLWFVEGLALHYWLTGDEESRNGVRGLARRVQDPVTSWNWTRVHSCGYKGEARPVARTLKVLVWTHRLGFADLNWPDLANRYTDLIINSDQWARDPADPRFGAWLFRHPDYPTGAGCTVEYVSNFMNAMILDALIDVYEHIGPDARIPGVVRRNLDYLGRTQWRGVEGNGLQITLSEPSPSFNYYDVHLEGSGGPGPSTDLNGFYPTLFAWYARHSGDASYMTIASRAFETLSRNPKDGRTAPWLSGDKQFNETYQRAWQMSGYGR